MTTVRHARERCRREGWSMFVYLDPPFWAKSSFLYRRSLTEIGHERLAEQLHWLRDPFLLSYDPAPEIAEFYKAHNAATVAEIELLYTGTARSAGRELVISNLPRLPAATPLWRSARDDLDTAAAATSG
jgi:site-specific DNA-adenine methylase